jgi:hypothetical protein
LCGERGSELESLNYINILNSQKNIFVEIYVEGANIGKFSMTNQNSGRSLLAISEMVNQCLRKYGHDTYRTARTDLSMSCMFEYMKRKELAGLPENVKFGRLMWENYNKSVGR